MLNAYKIQPVKMSFPHCGSFSQTLLGNLEYLHTMIATFGLRLSSSILKDIMFMKLNNLILQIHTPKSHFYFTTRILAASLMLRSSLQFLKKIIWSSHTHIYRQWNDRLSQ